MPQRSAGAPSIKDNKDMGLAPGDRPRGGIDGPEGAEPALTPRGLVPGSTLDKLDQSLQDMFSGTPGVAGAGTAQQLQEGDERPNRKPPDEEVIPPIIPGDPNNFGARGKRRRGQDDLDASPVFRRGLLGV